MELSYKERATEGIIETLLDHGQYPRPNYKRGSGYVTPRLDLYDILEPLIDASDLREYFILSIKDTSSCGVFSDSRDRWIKKITAMLEEFLNDSDIVTEVADSLREDDEQEYCTCSQSTITGERLPSRGCAAHGIDPDVARENLNEEMLA